MPPLSQQQTDISNQNFDQRQKVGTMAENSKIEWTHEPLILSYLAGMIDADGYISIQRSQHGKFQYFGPKLGIAGTRREPHDLASSLWGGKVSIYYPENPQHLPQYQWSRQGLVAARAIEEILPYLRIKTDQALSALELWTLLQDAKAEDPFPWFGSDFKYLDRANALKEEVIDLNRARNRSGQRSVKARTA